MLEDGETGLQLARAFWLGAVRPVLDEFAPGLPRAAARLGSGSDVLGLDDEMSRDHDWGLRLQVFVPAELLRRTEQLLADQLPPTFLGHPTTMHFTVASEPGPTVEVLTVEELIESRLGFDPRAGGGPLHWLSLTGQTVLEVTAGEVFEDADGGVTRLRRSLRWYPDDVWRYVVASDWQRIDQELPLMQRAGDRGDELGSRVIAARLVDAAIHLTFCLCREWMPYPKWAGTRFRELDVPARLYADLTRTLEAGEWRSRTARFASALTVLADVQAVAGLPSVDRVCVPFFERPYLHLNPTNVSNVVATIDDPTVRALPVGLGSVEQRTSNGDLLTSTPRRRQLVGCSDQ